MAGSEVVSWPRGIGAITLVVEDLADDFLRGRVNAADMGRPADH